MARGRASIIAALAFVALAAGAEAQASPFAADEKVQVLAAPSQDSSGASYQADCVLSGGGLYVDRQFAGTLPCSGILAPGPHYFQLELPGYDRLGIWLSLSAGTSYSIRFDPSGRIPLFAPSDRVSVSAQPTLVAGAAGLEVYCKAGGSLYVDRFLEGTVPLMNYLAFSLAPGSHYFELSLPGCYDLAFWLQLDEKRLYTIILDPEPITGFLALRTEPEDAAVLIDGTAAQAGRLELPVGEHRVEAKRFGYLDAARDAMVAEREETSLELKLEKAPFAVSDLAFSREAFNPRNPGAAGTAELSFEASSYGSAVVEIHGPDGRLAASLDFPDIETWRQAASWNGRGSDGSILPDGTYTATLVARPDPGFGAPGASGAEAGAPVTASCEVEIDSSLVVRPLGSLAAIPGLLYMPDPLQEPAGTVVAEASWLAPWAEPGDSIFGVSAALATRQGLSLAVHAAAEAGTASAASAASGDVELSTTLSFLGDAQSPVCGAFFLRGAYSTSSSPLMPGAGRSIEASLPFSLRLAYEKGALSLGLSPGAKLDFGSGAATVLGLARGGLWIELQGLRAGLSGELPLALSGGSGAPVSMAWPAEAALEGRFALGSTPLVAGVILGASLEPGSSASLLAGLSLGLLF